MGRRLSEEAEARFWDNVAATEAFFMGADPVHEALEKLGRTLDESVRAKYLEMWDALQTPDPFEQ